MYFLNARDVFCESESLFAAAAALIKSNYPDWGCSTHEEIGTDGSSWYCQRVSVPTLRNQLFATGYRSHQSVLMNAKFIKECWLLDRWIAASKPSIELLLIPKPQALFFHIHLIAPQVNQP